jgi:hypothetical protein
MNTRQWIKLTEVFIYHSFTYNTALDQVSHWSDILKTKFIYLFRLLTTIGTEITLSLSEHPRSTNFQVNIHVCYALQNCAVCVRV